ncbi:hypothetical protein MRB53_016309 [Persea americana]|uniref:Uncharacterized protein n=1 Tax=Persea americana TaxID=3435 RepID=A0ACC2M1V2_PERAE|nr:hypothetical protein MRB53_016309 [Persea americana]
MEGMKDLLFNGVMAHAKISDIAMALMGLFAFSALVQRLTNKGPMMWPIMGIIPTLFFHVHRIYDWATEALISCGGTFTYRGMWMGGAHGSMTVDPSNIEYMLKTRFSNFPKGRYYRERFSDLLGDGIFNADDEIWKEQRRAAALEMHSSRFINYSAKTIQNLVHNKLLKLIEKLAKSNDHINLQDVFLRFTFDNICTAAFGIDPDCLALHLPQVPFAKAFEGATELSLFRFLVPPFVWKLMKFFNVGSEKRLKEAVRVVHEFAEKTVVDRRVEWRKFGGLDDRSDLLSRLIEAQEGMNDRFSDKFMKMVAASILLRYSVSVVEGQDVVPKMTTTLYMKHDGICSMGLSTKVFKAKTEGMNSWDRSVVSTLKFGAAYSAGIPVGDPSPNKPYSGSGAPRI